MTVATENSIEDTIRDYFLSKMYNNIPLQIDRLRYAHAEHATLAPGQSLDEWLVERVEDVRESVLVHLAALATKLKASPPRPQDVQKYLEGVPEYLRRAVRTALRRDQNFPAYLTLLNTALHIASASIDGHNPDREYSWVKNLWEKEDKAYQDQRAKAGTPARPSR